MERCYVKQNLCLKDAIREIAKEESLALNEMAAFAVATKEGLFGVTILIGKDDITINKENLSESHVVTYNVVYNEDGSMESYVDSIDRDIYEGFKNGILNNENLKVSLLLDYKKN